GAAEVGQFVLPAAGDEVAIDDDRFVVIRAAGAANVVADFGGAGQVPAVEGAGTDEQLRAVADGGDAAVLVHEGACDVNGLFAEAEGAGGVAAGDEEQVVFGGVDLADGHVHLDAVVVRAGDGLAGRAGERYLDAFLAESVPGEEELQIVE